MKENKIIRQISVVLAVLLVWSCATSQRPYLKDYQTKFAPPGTVKIGSNLYYDETENRNLDYLEFMTWIEKVFGANSVEFKSTLIDSLIWNKFSALNLQCLDTFYLQHPSYRDYSVVGITRQQAETYSKWRSDRVFEFMLIGFGEIKFNQNLNKDNYFTIEKYFKGEYNNIKPDTSIHYIPYYHLPNYNEWQLALKYNDSLAKKSSLKCDESKCVEVFPNNENKNNKIPIRPSQGDCVAKHGLYNLVGNVREWSSNDSISFGGSWYDKASIVAKQDTFVTKTANAYTGFRNAFRWVDIREIQKR